MPVKNTMDWLLGHKMTAEEMLRKNQRALNQAMRDLDRERAKMEQQEKKIIADIKKLAKDGLMDAVKIMAQDLVRTRRYIRKFMLMKANIQAVALKIQTLKSQSSMSEAMRGVTRAMATMNRQFNNPQMQRILEEFGKQSAMLEMKEEVMSDAIDDAMTADTDEDESDVVVNQILDELGLQLTDQLSELPKATGTLSVTAKTPSLPSTAAAASGLGPSPTTTIDVDAELKARLDNLRKE